MKEDCIKYVIAKVIPILSNCSITIGKSYEVVHIINRTDGGKFANGKFTYNPKEPTFYITIKEDDNGERHSIWNDYFYSTEEIRNNIIEEILV